MKRTLCSRTTAAGLAVICLLSAASCSLRNSGGNDSIVKPKQTASEAIRHSYVAEPIGSTPDIDYVSNLIRLGDSGNVLVTGFGAKNEEMFITDYSFENFRKIEPNIELPENSEMYARFGVSPDGTIFETVSITDYGDMKLPDWSDPDFNYETFNFDALNEAAQQSYRLITYNSDGKELTNVEINDLERFSNTSEDEAVLPYLGGVYPIDSENAIAYLSSDRDYYAMLNSKGNFGETIDFDDDVWINDLCTSPDGTLAFAGWEEDGPTISTIDAETLRVNKNAIDLKEINIDSINKLLPGKGEFTYYVTTYKGIFGIRSNGDGEEIVNWLDSDIDGDSVTGVVSLAEGEFVIYLNNYSDPSVNGFYRISERDASEFAEKTLITIAVIYGDSSFKAEVNNFNRTNDKYRIKIKDYSEFYEWDSESSKQLNSPAKQFRLDVIAGNSPDMIFFSDPSVIKGLSSKGVFVDLYDYLGKDGTLKKEDLMPPLLNACEEDGKLYMLAPAFSLNTLAVKSKFCDKENWTLDDVIAAYDKLPEGAKLTQWETTKSSAFYYLSQQMNFVDIAKGTCNYDSPEFIKLLEFADRFPLESEEIDWENMSDDEINNYYSEQDTALMNDKALLGTIDLYDLRGYKAAKEVTFGDDITLVGYPSTDGCGMAVNQSTSFAILSDSPNKDECWKFISRFFTEEYEEKNSWSIPALKSVFEKKLDEAMEDPYWIDENGEKQFTTYTTYMGNNEFKVSNLTKDERDYIENLVMNANVRGMNYYDDDINSIVNEEIEAFFAGERSAKKTAEIIQNRVSILVSEQY